MSDGYMDNASPPRVPPHNISTGEGWVFIGRIIASHFILLFVLLPLILVSFELLGLFCVQNYLTFFMHYNDCLSSIAYDAY